MFKNFVTGLYLLLIFFVTAIYAYTAILYLNPDVIEHIDYISATVIIKNDKGQAISSGSCTVISVNGENYALTCAHVVGPGRLKDGTFLPVEILKWIDNGNNPKCLTYKAEVVRFSPDNDLALLHLTEIMIEQSAYLNVVTYVPKLGTDIYHIGSYLGDFAMNSFAKGSYVRNRGPVDQCNFTALPGSSGGGVFDTKGNFLGIVDIVVYDRDMIMHDAVVGIIPSRLIMDWAKENGVDWIFDKSLPAQNIDAVKSYPIQLKKT